MVCIADLEHGAQIIGLWSDKHTQATQLLSVNFQFRVCITRSVANTYADAKSSILLLSRLRTGAKRHHTFEAQLSRP